MKWSTKIRQYLYASRDIIGEIQTLKKKKKPSKVNEEVAIEELNGNLWLLLIWHDLQENLIINVCTKAEYLKTIKIDKKYEITNDLKHCATWTLEMKT